METLLEGRIDFDSFCSDYRKLDDELLEQSSKVNIDDAILTMRRCTNTLGFNLIKKIREYLKSIDGINTIYDGDKSKKMIDEIVTSKHMMCFILDKSYKNLYKRILEESDDINIFIVRFDLMFKQNCPFYFDNENYYCNLINTLYGAEVKWNVSNEFLLDLILKYTSDGDLRNGLRRHYVKRD